MQLDESINREKVVILPFYGEYGWFLNSYIRLVHYYISSKKVVCCRRGEEAYFPSATEFYYEWKDIFEDSEKCGFRNTWPIGPLFEETSEEKILATKLTARYPEHELLGFHYGIPPELVQYFPVPIKIQRQYNLHPDVVICARRRYAMGNFGDRGTRNYEQWPRIIEPLLESGYQIGIIGKHDTSYNFPGIQIRSWEYEDSVGAVFEMLSNARLFIGTDTGPTHLAALSQTPMILFRNEHEVLSPNMLKRCILPIAHRQGFYARIIPGGWDNPSVVTAAALKYLASVATPREKHL